MPYPIHRANMLDWIDAYEGDLFHAALFDPPYHLTSITKRFGKDGAAPAQYGRDGAFARASKGFMGRAWDGGGLMFDPATWEKIMRVLHPGAFVMAFASTRGYHRMAVAAEDAGFIIHTMALWTFFSGFPKATRLDTQIDRDAGAERETAGKHPNPGSTAPRLAMGGGWQDAPDMTLPAPSLAQTWAGHRYGGQALKPACEPILICQKPYAGRPVDCITGTGAGAFNIEAARIGLSGGGYSGRPSNGYEGGLFRGGMPDEDMGRWPANFMLAHTPECTEDTCAAGCPVALLDAQSGARTAGSSVSSETQLRGDTSTDFKARLEHPAEFESYEDEGGGSRFFFNADYMLERLENADPFIYAAKASTGEREAGLGDFALQAYAQGNAAQNAIANGEDEYLGNDRIGLNVIKQRRNPHPTVKPLSLVKHLASLLLPPDAYAPRRLFIPFSGAGSEMIGAMLAGWEHVEGVEMESEYIEVAKARLAFWQQMKPKIAGQKTPKAKLSAAPAGQKPLF